MPATANPDTRQAMQAVILASSDFGVNSIKLKAVKMYLEEGIGSTTIAKELNLSSNKRVLLWVKRYNEFGEDGLRERRGITRGLQKGRPRKRQLSLEEEN